MLASLSVIVSLAVLPFVAAQDALDIKAIEAHFEQSHIVEDYFPDFSPSALLTLNYPGVGVIAPGQRLTIPQVRPVPTVTVEGDDLDGNYTLAMIDVDVVGADTSAGVTRHWLVNGVTVQDDTVSNASAVAITPYAGPGPAAGSGAHRYIVALYEQPADFTPPEGFAAPLPVGVYNFLDYASNLGPLVAANYIVVEEGTYTGSVIPTSAVISSTLGLASGSASGSGSARPTGSKSGSAAPEPTDDEGSAAKVSTWAAPVVALFGGLAILAL